jgi:guanylate kinase
MNSSGLLVVISAPSGTGKGTLLGVLEKINPNVRFSISATTRKPRKGEIDGKNYFFKTIEEFNEMVKAGELIEWVEYCGNYYGTPKSYITDSLEQGYDVILEIEVEGAVKIKEHYPDCVLIFVLPPSFVELRNRIEKRGTESPDSIGKRTEKAKEEIKHIKRYDYVVINENVEKAVNDINTILKAEKLKTGRNTNIINLWKNFAFN